MVMGSSLGYSQFLSRQSTYRRRPSTTMRRRPNIRIAGRPLSSYTSLTRVSPGVTAAAPTSTAVMPSRGAAATAATPILSGGGLGLSLGGLSSDLSGIGGDILSRIKGFIPLAIKLVLVFIGIKVLFWVLRGRR